MIRKRAEEEKRTDNVVNNNFISRPEGDCLLIYVSLVLR